MARISRYIGKHNAPWIKESFTCSFCGKRTCKGSFWHGHDIVVICDACLRDGHVLGALLGDGVLDLLNKRHPTNSLELPNHLLSQTEGGMWRAIVHSLFFMNPDMTEVERIQKQEEERELAIKKMEDDDDED